jgi:feruloyl-CoA synthase
MSGTWVSVGPLRAQLIAAMSPHVRDVVITGHDRDSVAALAVPADPASVTDPAVLAELGETLTRLAATALGSAARVTRLAFLSGPLSIDANEVTDKGSVNQGAVLRARPDEVAALYAEPPLPHVLCAAPALAASPTR